MEFDIVRRILVALTLGFAIPIVRGSLLFVLPCAIVLLWSNSILPTPCVIPVVVLKLYLSVGMVLSILPCLCWFRTLLSAFSSFLFFSLSLLLTPSYTVIAPFGSVSLSYFSLYPIRFFICYFIFLFQASPFARSPFLTDSSLFLPFYSFLLNFILPSWYSCNITLVYYNFFRNFYTFAATNSQRKNDTKGNFCSYRWHRRYRYNHFLPPASRLSLNSTHFPVHVAPFGYPRGIKCSFSFPARLLTHASPFSSSFSFLDLLTNSL